MLYITVAANEKGQGAMENMEKKITETIELLKYNMFKDAKMEVLNKFMDLKVFAFHRFSILFNILAASF